jgi:hypothetical protein
MNKENIAEVQQLFRSETEDRRIVLDVKDRTLVDRNAVKFLERCEADRVKPINCPAYIPEWIEKERGQSKRRKR